jgi:hypothetical protein
VFKLDIALRPDPTWRDEGAGRCGHVHLGATLGEIARSELDVGRGRRPGARSSCPSVELFDESRAGGHEARCLGLLHVPGIFERGQATHLAQIERAAPGFRGASWPGCAGRTQLEETPTTSAVTSPAAASTQGPARFQPAQPALFDPYSTPHRSIYLLGATPPAAAFSMGGYNTAQSVSGG